MTSPHGFSNSKKPKLSPTCILVILQRSVSTRATYLSKYIAVKKFGSYNTERLNKEYCDKGASSSKSRCSDVG